MSSAGVPAVRVLDVLAAAGDGIVLHDWPDSLTVWIDAQFRDLPTQIRQELQVWIDVLRHGTPRRRARPRRTTFARAPRSPSEFVNPRASGFDAFYCHPGVEGAHEKQGLGKVAFMR